MTSQRPRGFSLVELMITVLVVAVLTAIAWPSFRNFMHRNAVTAQANQVLASLQYARNEAVSRRHPAGLCGSTDGASCTSTSALENGWLVWLDTSLTGTPSYSAGTDELLRVNQAQPNITINFFKGTTAVDTVAFDQRGAVIGAGGVTYNIVVCAKDKPEDTNGINNQTVPGKYVRIDASGRVTVENLATTDTCTAAPG